MKRTKALPYLMMLGLAFGSGACSDDKLDEINTNPNSPEQAPLLLLMPQVTVGAAFSVSGTDLAWYSAVFTEMTTGVHAQFEQADKRSNGSFVSTATSNNWNDIYAGQLQDLDYMIAKGSTGEEAGAWRYVGIAKVLKAYNLSVATDLFGRVPYTEANKPSVTLKPAYDPQQQIYQGLNALLDDAILDLAKESNKVPGASDFFYAGDAAKWTKAAYALKARLANHLSKRDPNGSAAAVLAALPKAFASSADNLTFSRYAATAIGENPWFQEENDRGHFAVSTSFYNLLRNIPATAATDPNPADNDPRISFLIDPVRRVVGGPIVGAPNGTAVNDQGGTIYSRVSRNVINATAAQPIITFAELKFIEAEARLRTGDRAGAYEAYVTGVNTDLTARGASTSVSTSTTAASQAFRDRVFMGAAGLTQQAIIQQKYISLFIYQSIEAYNDYRRTGFPTLSNPKNSVFFPRRFPYPQSEIATNSENVPNTTIANGVWWDDGTED
ncbi:SusD/RagB family nutrient-binding outer membrane lipoprotein [Hymenobacter lapidiphilus]|uniref:SusD/RagB family nutrient-binding outer membrane lipoprotein n=1 Tax=Hymenobacter lapidiphilus TaxID=2608003 RepID=A0A7Y7U4L0_9BACT|nr:SusD/RagB family nutrient-binding outer membrane lipoprotein [Hymenobacter lapidiphilus]NVO30523.1 SusD/RagB family nutrient-binding outer membrane lipoprotein [Hymenobacter lapidiphilus]